MNDIPGLTPKKQIATALYRAVRDGDLVTASQLELTAP